MTLKIQNVNFSCNYLFGWVMPGRELVSPNKYRFGYQGEFSEKDEETGRNQFELRSLDTRVGRRMSPDPAHQYFSPYRAMGNNPVNGVDPDGAWNFPALKWARANISNKGIKWDEWYTDVAPSGFLFVRNEIPSQIVCYSACFMSYMNSPPSVTNYLKSGFSYNNGSFKGRVGGKAWFKAGNGLAPVNGYFRAFLTDPSLIEPGDILFFGKDYDMGGHAVMATEFPVYSNVKDAMGNITYEQYVLNSLSTSSDSDYGSFGERQITIVNTSGKWEWIDGNGNYHDFIGFGQMSGPGLEKPSGIPFIDSSSVGPLMQDGTF